MTAGGASAEEVRKVEPEPMCMKIAVPVSAQAARKGSQWRSGAWIVGRPSRPGSSEKATARTPRAALRRTSAAASPGSQSGTRQSGIRRFGAAPDHSSTIQSL